MSNPYVIIRGGLAQDYSPEVEVFDLDVFEADFTDVADLEFVRDRIWTRIDLLPEDYRDDFRVECLEFIDKHLRLIPDYTDAEAFLNDEEPA